MYTIADRHLNSVYFQHNSTKNEKEFYLLKNKKKNKHDFTCPDCGHDEFDKDNDTFEVFCHKCGRILRKTDNYDYDLKNWSERHNRPEAHDIVYYPHDFYGLVMDYGDNVLLKPNYKLESEITKIESKYGWKTKKRINYRKFKQRYYDLFIDKLLNLGYSFIEAESLFNNDFQYYYNENIKRGVYKSRDMIIEEFLDKYNICYKNGVTNI